jgi:bifunctional non-homologous end joining protein LigD
MIEQYVLAPAAASAVLAHYERAVDLIVANFPLAPIVPVYFPDGLDKKPWYGGSVHGKVPHSIPTVETGTADDPRPYIAAAPNSVLWLVHRGAVGIESWTPSPTDPHSVGCARIILIPHGGASQDDVTSAMFALRTDLLHWGVSAIPVLDGFAGAALFIPFNDAPAYEPVRAWLHEVAGRAVGRCGQLLTADARDHTSKRVHVNVLSNAVHHFSSLPYALIGSPALGMVTPLEWDEVGHVHNGEHSAANSDKRLEHDVFGRLKTELAYQSFASTQR